MIRVAYSASARRYLLGEIAYLRQYSPRAASNFANSMRDARDRLSRFPEMGFVLTSPPVPGNRRLVVGDYLIDYHLGQSITITAIRHGRQRDPEAVLTIDDD